MFRRFFLAAAGMACGLVAAGCGNSAGLVPVSGKVLYKGEPATGAVVYFQRQGEPCLGERACPVRDRAG